MKIPQSVARLQHSIKLRILKPWRNTKRSSWKKVIINPLFSFHPKGTSDFLPSLGDAVMLIFCLAKSRANSWTLGMSGLIWGGRGEALKLYSHSFMSEF